MAFDFVDTVKTIGKGLKRIETLSTDIHHLNDVLQAKEQLLHILSVTIEMQTLVMRLQQHSLTLENEIAELNKTRTQATQFTQEKDQYSLFQYPTGTVVYRIKQSPSQTGQPSPRYDYCYHCFEQGIKSILQPEGYANGFKMVKCFHCASCYPIDRLEQECVIMSEPRRWDNW